MPTTAYEGKKMISTTKPKNSCGVDEFPTKLLRYLPSSILELLTHLFNQSLSAGKYISVFKVAKVTPLFKHRNAQLVSNYRPTSVLSAFSKILEKLVHKRILSFLNQNNILFQLQFRFRPTFSTQLACSFLSSKITDLFNDNNLVLAIFLDLTKAFEPWIMTYCLLSLVTVVFVVWLMTGSTDTLMIASKEFELKINIQI